jgi:hypothetical protein
MLYVAFRTGQVNTDELIRLCVRQRTQQYTVDNAEHCCRRANAERQCRHRGTGEPGISGRAAKGMAHVAQQTVHVNSFRGAAVKRHTTDRVASARPICQPTTDATERSGSATLDSSC